MRRYGILIICIVTMAGLYGCKGTAEKTLDQQTLETPSGEEQNTEIANPWKFDVAAEDVKNLTGREFTVPEGASDVTYGIMEHGKLAEMNFTLDGKRYCVRMKPAADFEDISGLFYDEWDAEGVDEINGAEAHIRQYFGETINSVLWFDGSMMYSVYTSEGDKDGFDVLKIAKITAGEEETSDTAAYDMYGFVIDKLPEDEYYNHYNVKGDNDEIYICNYNGNDELAEGTYVGMWQIQDGGWTIEVIDEP